MIRWAVLALVLTACSHGARIRYPHPGHIQRMPAQTVMGRGHDG